MPRTTSLSFRQAVNAQDTSEVILILLELDQTDFPAPVRVVNNTQDIVSNGQTYIAFPFVLELPDDIEENLPEAILSIDNIDPSILIPSIRGATGPINAIINIVMASDPDTIEAGPFNFTIRRVDYTDKLISATLEPEAILSEPFPSGVFDPIGFPGLFK